MKTLDIYCSNAWMKPIQMDSLPPVSFAGVAQYWLWELIQLFPLLQKRERIHEVEEIAMR